MNDAWNFIKQVAGALGAIHRCGFGHFDVKPANIFTQDEAEGKTTYSTVAPWQCECALTSLSELGDLDGLAPLDTWHATEDDGDKWYLSPECLNRRAEHDPTKASSCTSSIFSMFFF